MGRPAIYTTELADAVCERLTEGESLRSICEAEDMPSRATVLRWLASDHDGFEAKYVRAREIQAEMLAEDLLEISDDGRNDWMERKGAEDSGWVANGENLQRSKLRVETRKWIASKLLPKRYGDKQQVEHSVSDSLAQTILAARKRSGKAAG